MFQLIVAVVAIALAVLAAVMAIWFGGSAFSGANEKATFARYLNQGGQIEAGLKLYQTDKGTAAVGTSDEILGYLTGDHYLSTVPPGGWKVDGTSIYKQLDDLAQCKRLNKFAGKDLTLTSAADDGCPPCSDANFADWPGCRRAAIQ